MKIYTRTGDTGKTSLFDNTRVWKNSIRVETYGTIDELNSVLGIVTSELALSKKKAFKNLLKTVIQVQTDLFSLGSSLATPGSMILDFDVMARIAGFEKEIDTMWNACPELTNFILPGGSTVGAHLHLARTISRRAERNVIALVQKEEVDPKVIAYINRLSDLFFAMARYANHLEKKKEVIWKR